MKQAGKAPIDPAVPAGRAPDNRALLFRGTRLMSTPAVPFKTPLGLDELRHRTRGLGQRHRTVLLLVDGHRPLGDVLGMAHRAGASTGHFEELVRLGLVEMPVQPAQDAPETAPGVLDQPRLTTVEVEVPTPPEPTPDPGDALISEPSPAIHDDGPDTEANPDVVPVPDLTMAGEPQAHVRPPSSAPKQLLPTRAGWVPFRVSPAAVAHRANPQPADSEHSLRQQVRSLLIGALGGEAALFSPLTLTRIRIAQTPRELITLVWEIERQRNHLRRSQAQLLNLQRARELLGMGNTLVAGDSQTGAVWPDTAGR